jgi:carbamoyl-phosphate synthase large subunit
MRSTGEALGLSESFGLAFYKALEGGKTVLPLKGAALISVAKQDRAQAAETARQLERLGFEIFATGGTLRHLLAEGIKAEYIKKLYEGRPNIEDAIKNRQLDLIINTPSGSKRSGSDDSYIRKLAIQHNIPYVTTLTAALASVKGIEEQRQAASGQVSSLQEYHSRI